MSVFIREMLGQKKPNAMRCLFPIDDNDRARLHKELDIQEKKIDEAKRMRFISRWNFDPVKGEPVEGGDFELLDPLSVPAFYTSGYRHRPSRPSSRSTSRYHQQSAAAALVTAAGRPAKRKLRFGDACNDENREVSTPEAMSSPAKHSRLEDDCSVDSPVVIRESRTEILSAAPTATTTTTSSTCNLPFSSPPASPGHPQPSGMCPPSPSVLSVPCVPHVASSLKLTAVSSARRNLDFVTPSLRPGQQKMLQTEITDFCCIKKKSLTKESSS